MKKNVVNAGSRVIIVMSQSRSSKDIIFGTIGGNFEVKMFKPKSATHFWNANFEIQGDLGINKTVTKVVSKLIMQLEIDGYL